ncbi:MAG TPA: dihydrofolate reductase family protein [candidate division Zixibacteria bacterium]|nr:dihydrofolate reductase family protein [candidate division Zixibacteria bacterium]
MRALAVPAQPDLRPLQPLLVDAGGTAPAGRLRGGRLPAPLAERYGGDLAIPLREDRPTVVANFVSTLDGVVSYATPEAAGGGEISGFFEPDRFVMGLLRSVADAVLIGAGTLRAARAEAWTPAHIHPSSAPDYAQLRAALGLRPNPTTVVVTASGQVDLTHPGLAGSGADVLVLTTDAGAAALERQRPARHIEIEASGSHVLPSAIIDALGARDAELVLCEGGPHLFAQLLGGGLVDELFLTLSPQLAGRSPTTPRLALTEGVAFDLASAPWARLVDARRAGSHLFTRYRLDGRNAP